MRTRAQAIADGDIRQSKSKVKIVLFQPVSYRETGIVMRPGKTAKKRKAEERRKWKHAKSSE